MMSPNRVQIRNTRTSSFCKDIFVLGYIFGVNSGIGLLKTLPNMAAHPVPGGYAAPRTSW